MRDAAVELGLLSTTLRLDAAGIATLPLACTGSRECVASVQLFTPRRRGAARAASATTVRVEPGRRIDVRLRLSGTRGRQLRARVVIRMQGIRGHGRRIERSVLLRRR